MWPLHLADLVIFAELVGYTLANLKLGDCRFDIGFHLVVPIAITACTLGCERLGGVPTETRTVRLQFASLLGLDLPQALNIGRHFIRYPVTYCTVFITCADLW